MRQDTEREILLQNLLAMGASLLHRSAKAMRSGHIPTQTLLVVECEIWFSEAHKSLLALISAQERAKPGSAPSAERPGENWKAPPATAGLSPASDATSTPPDTKLEVPSSEESSGRTIKPLKTQEKPSINALSYFFVTKP
jgi:hypothetical protein